jgi:lipid-binding SYLF domain-containing protein
MRIYLNHAYRRITMQRRNFILSSGAMLAAGGLAMAGCTTTGQSSANSTAGNADKRASINHDVDATLSRLYATVNGSRELVAKARGVLVFPQVVQAGFVIGGQYGQGALRVGGATTGYYSTAAGSFGLQAGAQSKAIIFCFMTENALADFRSRDGWAVGGDATVAVVKVGANGNIDSSTATAPVQAFVLTNAGLMAGVSLEGTKVSKLDI